MAREFVRFVEVNDWEGVTWNFWLQRDGNEKQLVELLYLLNDTYLADEAYELCMDDVETEDVVDKLCEYADENYMATHNKIVGVLTTPVGLGQYGHDLYKGGIKDLFS